MIQIHTSIPPVRIWVLYYIVTDTAAAKVDYAALAGEVGFLPAEHGQIEQ